MTSSGVRDKNRHKATSIYFELDEVPIKARPRGTVVYNEQTGKTATRYYTPKETVEQEKRIREAYKAAAREQMGGLAMAGKGVPIRLEVVTSRPTPRGKKISIESDTHTPDIDNIVKAIMDGLNGTAFQDDSQVTQLVAVKRPRKQGIPEHVSVRITHLSKKKG